MTRLDLFGGVFLTTFGLFMIFVAIPMGTEDGMYYGLPPTFFPTLLASGLTLCAAGLTVQSVFRMMAGRTGDAVPISRWNLLMFALLVAVIFAGVVLLDIFGLVIGAPLLIATLMVILGDRSPLRIVLTSVLPVAAFYYLALHILHTPVP
ncbi:tripartite tricarboxylate transporter TctB family protein [Puniceibacterium sp. IMCC21224]|uniref:tripartite tricarboxylate transporter TctB family protein n=1 Tax=Puniceibacterium sp. IMCC21224 TaxID=1618204 RepID=UPI00065D0571|nr:tripartite tricarboxylate transporter TctB family protein [Puniceibacterium sp. IMCC21224]KMK64858.1 Tripartite tricarboxylate transporter TctB family [Puniceibacterium sp. IMCC21224]